MPVTPCLERVPNIKTGKLLFSSASNLLNCIDEIFKPSAPQFSLQSDVTENSVLIDILHFSSKTKISDRRYLDISNFYLKIFIQCILILFFPISLPTQLHILTLSCSSYIYFDHISPLIYATPYSLSQKKKKAKQTLKNQ